MAERELELNDIDETIKNVITRLDPGWDLPVKVEGIKMRITTQALEAWRLRMLKDFRETLEIASGIAYIKEEISVRPEIMDRAIDLQKQGVSIIVPEY